VLLGGIGKLESSILSTSNMSMLKHYPIDILGAVIILCRVMSIFG
jgi:hypothetical protein